MGPGGAPIAGGGGGSRRPPLLEFYGDFGLPAGRCQRAVSLAARRCFDSTLSSHLRCAAATLLGRPCRRGMLDARLDAATQATRSAIAASCTSGHLAVIGYLGLDDVTRACRDEADAVTSLE